jgi:hypothetical protein
MTPATRHQCHATDNPEQGARRYSTPLMRLDGQVLELVAFSAANRSHPDQVRDRRLDKKMRRPHLRSCSARPFRAANSGARINRGTRMITTREPDQTTLQMPGEAPALAPMPLRSTHPVLAATRQQVSAPEGAHVQSAQPAGKPRKLRALRPQASEPDAPAPDAAASN